ncbi:hypothetical protein ACJX0J_014563, partial [Zea mays]
YDLFDYVKEALDFKLRSDLLAPESGVKGILVPRYSLDKKMILSFVLLLKVYSLVSLHFTLTGKIMQFSFFIFINIGFFFAFSKMNLQVHFFESIGVLINNHFSAFGMHNCSFSYASGTSQTDPLIG